MTRALVFAACIAAAIISVDIAFLREHFWARLAANLGIVLIAAAIYWRFFK